MMKLTQTLAAAFFAAATIDLVMPPATLLPNALAADPPAKAEKGAPIKTISIQQKKDFSLELSLTLRSGTDAEIGVSANSIGSRMAKTAGWEKSPTVTHSAKDGVVTVSVTPNKDEKPDMASKAPPLTKVEVMYRRVSVDDFDPGDYTIVVYATFKDKNPSEADLKAAEPLIRQVGAFAARKSVETTRIKQRENKEGVIEYSAW